MCELNKNAIQKTLLCNYTPHLSVVCQSIMARILGKDIASLDKLDINRIGKIFFIIYV